MFLDKLGSYNEDATLCSMFFMTTGFTAYANESSDEKLELLTYEEYKQQLNNKNNSTYSNEDLSAVTKKNPLRSISKIKNTKKDITYINSMRENKINIPHELVESSKLLTMGVPIANLEVAIINPETLKNGVPTMETMIAWFYADTHPDGDMIVDRQVGGFPGAYLLGEFNDKSGFVTQFTDPGSYQLLYRSIDEKGEMSDVISYSINVVPIEYYQVFEGNFASLNDVKTFDVSIDFSTMTLR